jgi:hypothetical protein
VAGERHDQVTGPGGGLLHDGRGGGVGGRTDCERTGQAGSGAEHATTGRAALLQEIMLLRHAQPFGELVGQTHAGNVHAGILGIGEIRLLGFQMNRC